MDLLNGPPKKICLFHRHVRSPLIIKELWLPYLLTSSTSSPNSHHSLEISLSFSLISHSLSFSDLISLAPLVMAVEESSSRQHASTVSWGRPGWPPSSIWHGGLGSNEGVTTMTVTHHGRAAGIRAVAESGVDSPSQTLGVLLPCRFGSDSREQIHYCQPWEGLSLTDPAATARGGTDPSLLTSRAPLPRRFSDSDRARCGSTIAGLKNVTPLRIRRQGEA